MPVPLSDWPVSGALLGMRANFLYLPEFMRQTGLLGQYKTLDEDRNDWIAGADVNKNDTSTKKGPARRTGYATGPQGDD